jgi:hypothetical protein
VLADAVLVTGIDELLTLGDRGRGDVLADA